MVKEVNMKTIFLECQLDALRWYRADILYVRFLHTVAERTMRLLTEQSRPATSRQEA